MQTYVHLTTNNTIEGTAVYDIPDTNGVPVIADMSSNILAARYNVEDFAMIYAGAQKEYWTCRCDCGDCCVRISSMISHSLSSMLDYRIQAGSMSLYIILRQHTRSIFLNSSLIG